MAGVIDADNLIEEIPLDQLLFRTMKMKDAGRRLVQACVAYVDSKFELSYSFADDSTYDMTTLRIVLTDLAEEVPSISNIYPYASFYEDEMHELFDVNIEMIGLDYHDKLYRIRQEAPMIPKEAVESIHEELKEKAEGEKDTPDPGEAEEKGGKIDG